MLAKMCVKIESEHPTNMRAVTSIVQVVSSAILGDNAAPNMRLDVNGQLILGLGAGLSALIGAGAIML